jgi:hypothetical protein
LVALLVLGWLATRWPLGLKSSRVADMVDGWDGFFCLARAASVDFNLLTDTCYPGYTALPLIAQGAGILGTGILPLSLESVQAAHLFGIAAAAIGLAWTTASLIDVRVAPVAAATFLFAPITMMGSMWTAGSSVFGVYTVALLVALRTFERSRSPAALVGLALVAGVALRCPPLPIIVALATWRVFDTIRSDATVPRSALATAAATFLAAFLPGLSGVASLGDAVASYGGGAGSWVTMEAALFGQISPARAEAAIGAHPTAALDGPLSLLLSAFFTPRTALRLWGDALLDPLGALLAACGVAVAMKTVWRRGLGRFLLLLLASAMVPGLLSSYDRPSLLRVSAAVVPLAMLSASGLATVWPRLFPRVGLELAAASAAGAIAVGGTLLFDVINPGILARAPLAIVLDALDPAQDPTRVVVLEEVHWKPDYVRPSAVQLPTKPIRVWSVRDLEALDGSSASVELLFWSPGEEETYAVSRSICRRQAHATLFSLSDAAGISTVFGAALGPGTVVPASAGQRNGCTEALPTEASKAERARTEASRLVAAGRGDEAAAVLERQAMQSFAQPALFEATARQLLAEPAEPPALLRAAHWAARACALGRGSDPAACATEGLAHATLGNTAAALRATRQAKRAALGRGDDAFATELESRIQTYARQAMEQP